MALTSYTDCNTKALVGDFQVRCLGATLRYIYQTVVPEASGAANHANRAAYARAVVANPQAYGYPIAFAISAYLYATANATTDLSATTPNDAALDTAISANSGQLFNMLSGVS